MPQRATDRLLFFLFPKYRARWEIYEEVLQSQLARASVWVDVGCGNNEHVARFGARVRLAAGIDRVDHGDRRDGLFIRADLRALPFAGATADLVTLRLVVEHLEDPDRDLQEIARVLRPGGRMIVLTTNASSPLIMVPRLLPMRTKMWLLRRLYGVSEEDIFPTFHRFNSRRRMLRGAGGLRLVSLRFLEQVPRESSMLLFAPFFLWYLFSAPRMLSGVRSNLLAVFEKQAQPGAS